MEGQTKTTNAKNAGRKEKYPFSALQINETFIYAENSIVNKNKANMLCKVRNKNNSGKIFTVKISEENKIQILRTA